MALRTILAIDPGILNLGWVLVRGRHRDGRRPAEMAVVRHGLENLTRPCREPGCTLPRSRELWDRLGHTHAVPCDEADVIVVERQPPGGLGEVVSFFYERHGPKVVRVHPRSMHAFYGISGFNYDGRKACVENIARNWLAFKGTENRCHDIADAACMAFFYLSTTPPPHPTVAPPHWMDAFRYTPAPAPAPAPENVPPE